jgi:hypothetical protein
MEFDDKVVSAMEDFFKLLYEQRELCQRGIELISYIQTKANIPKCPASTRKFYVACGCSEYGPHSSFIDADYWRSENLMKYCHCCGSEHQIKVVNEEMKNQFEGHEYIDTIIASPRNPNERL